jgi:hypothetical protein
LSRPEEFRPEAAKKKPAVGGFFNAAHASTHHSLPNNDNYVDYRDVE